MKVRHTHISLAIRSALLLAMLPIAAQAQDTTAPSDAKTLEAIQVTGSRIKQTDKVTSAPVAIITRAQLDKTGVESVGEVLQQLTASGKALNAKFNSSGNFGYPADGGGIGAGSAQVDLRNLESKRVLVLVDGIRWVNESSASGVSGSADLNTIPLAIVDHIEVLEDGASAIYGSDAIAGVINIITKKNFEGVAVHTYFGEYDEGDGQTTEANITLGGGGDRFNGVFAASYFDQDRISSGDRDISLFPVPGAGLSRGSSGTPQARMIFCDPNNLVPNTPGFCDPGEENWYDITLNNGVVLTPGVIQDPTGPNYHSFSGADRFNFAPFNLILTPSTRKSLFASVSYDLTDNTRIHAKALYNNRTSANQAAPEPIFVGPGAQTGGIADTITISALNPYNPFGYDLTPGVNFDFIGRRPLEAGPRIFNQDVDTWYFDLGLDGSFGSSSWGWDANYVHTENKATQTFYNGFNVAKLKIALGDPAICAATPGCVPFDIFGGQGRPITQDQLDYVRVTTQDASKQVLDLISFNINGDLFNISDRPAGFAAGIEHRKYQGDFNPDPLRQTGESQDSFAAPVSADYDVDEIYAEINLPFAETFSANLALRYSDYSTFGGATTGKVGFRWQPTHDWVFRGTYSQGFRAPNLGELYGLTQFGATLTDPCSNNPACVAAGIVPAGYEQNNTQIITFTGGNPDLQPENSDSYTLGAVYSPTWAEDLSWSKRMDFELGYYHHKITDAIQAPDIQTLLINCVAADIAGTPGPECAGFTRQASGNLNPPTDFLDNIGEIKTSGVDFKANWLSPETSWGTFSVAWQTTHVINYDATGSARKVGVEVNDSAIPDYQTNVQLGWKMGSWDVAWNVRYISRVTESCSDFRDGTATSFTNLGLCSDPNTTDNSLSLNDLGATTYNDLQVAWNKPFDMEGLKFAVGVNNIFDRDPPPCLSCSLNGYDAGTYDLPGQFWYVSIDYKF